MFVNQCVVYLLVGFAVLGALDKILNNRFGLGEKFEDGFRAMGPLALAMIGITSIAPVLAHVLTPIVAPLYTFLGADPSIFAGTILANDMGGYQLALHLAHTEKLGQFSGLIVGALMGPTIVFTIPIALGILEKHDHPAFTKGILAGIITVPLGAFAGGLMAGFSTREVLINLLPLSVISIAIAIGLWKWSEALIRGFAIFAKVMLVIVSLSTAAILIETVLGLSVIPGMAPFSEGLKAVGNITLILAGAFPMVYVINCVFQKPLLRVGKILNVNDVAITGMLAALANNIPTFSLIKDMDERGKVFAVAFAVSAAFVFGDHLGFTAGVNRAYIFPVIIAKLTGGISALLVAHVLAPKSVT